MSEARNTTKATNHPYHLVDPSPWPAGRRRRGGHPGGRHGLFMHGVTAWFVPHRLSCWCSLTMFLWWRDVVREATYQGHHTPIVQLGLRYGMVLFIASEVMFFAAFFWAFFDASLFPKEATGFTLAAARASRSSIPSTFPSSTP